jgi:hypothetical protein
MTKSGHSVDYAVQQVGTANQRLPHPYKGSMVARAFVKRRRAMQTNK